MSLYLCCHVFYLTLLPLASGDNDHDCFCYGKEDSVKRTVRHIDVTDIIMIQLVSSDVTGRFLRFVSDDLEKWNLGRDSDSIIVDRFQQYLPLNVVSHSDQKKSRKQTQYLKQLSQV